ncbi:MAG: hypothetical protein OXF56_15110 [Rhodobacteraceae bacterium]|nr:hypothetical protein [Paracoccaceae bacterium]
MTLGTGTAATITLKGGTAPCCLQWGKTMVNGGRAWADMNLRHALTGGLKIEAEVERTGISIPNCFRFSPLS